MALYSTSTEDLKTVVCFFIFQKIIEEPKKSQTQLKIFEKNNMMPNSSHNK